MTAANAPRDDPSTLSRTIDFSVAGHRCALSVAPPGNPAVPSVFLVSLAKAGSTLLNLLMKPLVRRAGLTYVSLPEALRKLGVPPREIPAEVNGAFEAAGYAFGGFRSIPGAFALPAYAAGRTVLLVRDPRDMLTSLYFSVTFSHKPPGQGVGGALAKKFDASRGRAAELGIDGFVLDGARSVISQFAQVEEKLAAIPHRLYRYEDVIFDKLNWVQDMLDNLGLTVDPRLVERVVARHDIRPDAEDVTLHVRKVAPGDHVAKLRPETIAQLNAQFAPILTRYGYAES